MFEG
jgi:hypothetical protein